MHCRRSAPRPASEEREVLLRSETLPPHTSDVRGIDEAWSVVLGAARQAEPLARANEDAALSLTAGGELIAVPPGHPDAVIAWRHDTVFSLALPPDDPRHAM